MSQLGTLTALVLGLGMGIAGHYLYVHPPAEVTGLLSGWHLPREVTSQFSAWHGTAPAAERKVIYYRDPSGAPYWSAAPKKDSNGRDFLPVYDDEEPSFEPSPTPAAPTATSDQKPPSAAPSGDRKILYYRNPMGLPDTSTVPKKDPMGMDYVPVYQDEQEEPGTVKVSLDKVQRIGVKTEKVEVRPIVRPVRAVGKVDHDEALLTIVSMRSEGYIEDLFVNKTGQHVHQGEPLFRVYSPQIQQAQTDLLVAMHAQGKIGGVDGNKALEGAMQRLRNLGVPQSRIDEVRKTGTNPRTLDWPAPADGDVIEKKILNGQRVASGDELYRIADHSQVWVIADVAEADIASIGVGMPATVILRAMPTAPVEGKVTFIYPELNAETRTVPVRIELPNPEQRMRTGMYADVTFKTDTESAAVTAVPTSAIIDSGTKQVILVDKGEGRFEPRAIKLGRRGDGFVEVTDGLKPGEEIVTSANFLLDAESNLKAALQTFGQQETP